MKTRQKTLKPKWRKKYFDKLKFLDDLYIKAIYHLEEAMKIESGIKDIEFVWVDGCIVGIGTPTRKKKIPIHRP